MGPAFGRMQRRTKSTGSPTTIILPGGSWIADRDVLLVLSGMSMVNAAMITCIALDRFDVTALVLSRIAGCVDLAHDMGDVVVAAQRGQYLDAIIARETEEGFSMFA